jgi:hypothetical protein
MEVQKPQILIAKRIGISETDVENCRNITQLRNWKIEIGKDMSNISSQLHKHRITADLNSTHLDPYWEQKAITSRDLLALLVEKIVVRIEELKMEKTQIALNFMEIARANLDPDVFLDFLIQSESL